MISAYLNLDKFPIDQPDTDRYNNLVSRCKTDLHKTGLFNLSGFLLAEAARQAVDQILPVMSGSSFDHKRKHNIYFQKKMADLDADHPALKEYETINRTVCADQIAGSIPLQLYNWQPFINFLTEIMELPRLHVMDDDLACVNVMAYRDSEALNWHFDRSEFTTTLLLQAANAGGEFQYKTGLRSDLNPSYDNIAEFLTGDQRDIETLPLAAGTVNIFRGRNTLHRVSPVKGNQERIITVFSYYQKPGVRFSREEQLGFYGRSNV
ncbi:MAG: hypothetical protein ACI845_003175 [Gammaproteobacteria bacterium]|jgi:hypothetical protein